MWTININRREGAVHVRVGRWPAQGRYPVDLADFELVDQPAESELALIGRCARAVELELEARRLDEFPELPY